MSGVKGAEGRDLTFCSLQCLLLTCQGKYLPQVGGHVEGRTHTLNPGESAERKRRRTQSVTQDYSVSSSTATDAAFLSEGGAEEPNNTGLSDRRDAATPRPRAPHASQSSFLISISCQNPGAPPERVSSVCVGPRSDYSTNGQRQLLARILVVQEGVQKFWHPTPFRLDQNNCALQSSLLTSITPEHLKGTLSRLPLFSNNELQ